MIIEFSEPAKFGIADWVPLRHQGWLLSDKMRYLTGASVRLSDARADRRKLLAH
jgi:hypothetical protein